MKKILLTLFAVLTMSFIVNAQGTADFSTTSANSSYSTVTTTNGWIGTNCAVLQYGTANSGYNFSFITDGQKAFCMNGKTTAVGSITSPTLEGGIGTLTFNYGHPFSEKNGINITISVIQNGTTVQTATFTKTNSEVTKNTAYDYSEEFNVAGDFVLEIKNNSPTGSTSNKDRVAIWNLEWTGYEGGDDDVQKPSAPTFSLASGTYYGTQSVELSCVTEGADIYYTLDETDPDPSSNIYSKPYSEAIQVSETTTIKAIAIKDNVPSNVATATYTLVESVSSIAEFYEKTNKVVDVQAYINCDLTVIAVAEPSIYVTDGTDYSCVYKYGTDLKSTDVISKGWMASYGEFKGLYEIVPVGELSTSGTGTLPTPEEITATGCTVENQSKYVILRSVDVFPQSSGTFTGLDVNNNEVIFYNKFSIGVPEQQQAKYDITGIVSVYNTTVQIYPLSYTYVGVTTGVEEIGVDANAPVEYYNLQGVRVAAPENGIFIRKQGSHTTKVIL